MGTLFIIITTLTLIRLKVRRRIPIVGPVPVPSSPSNSISNSCFMLPWANKSFTEASQNRSSFGENPILGKRPSADLHGMAKQIGSWSRGLGTRAICFCKRPRLVNGNCCPVLKPIRPLDAPNIDGGGGINCCCLFPDEVCGVSWFSKISSVFVRNRHI